MPSEEGIAQVEGAVDWSARTVVVAGLGPVGMSAIDALHHLGATVVAVDEIPIAAAQQEQADIFEFLGVELRTGVGMLDSLPLSADLVVAAEPHVAGSALLAEAKNQGITLWGELELAWHARSDTPAPWLAVAGSAGRNQIATMATQILVSAGVRTQAVGEQTGLLLPAILDPDGPAALVVELSEFQLALQSTYSAVSVVVMHAQSTSRNPFDNVQAACIYNVEDEATRVLVEDADVIEGARAIGVSQGTPDLSMIGLVEGIVIDRAFVADRRNSAEELFDFADFTDHDETSRENAMAAAALVRSVGVPAAAVKQGLKEYFHAARS